MNIFRYIKSKFIKDKCIGILNISSLINIPGRLYFKDDLNSIKEIDEYKSIYYKLLNNRTKLLTRDIKIDSLQEDIIMNVELLIKNSLNTNYLELDKLELKVYHLKLYLYLNELDILKKRLIIRLISLKELQDEKIIPHINRETLSIEINNLSITLLTILNQLSAINIERNNILDNISLNNKLDNEELLKLRYDETRELYKYIKGKKLNDNILMELSYMDRYLEIYAYKTKDKMSILNRKLDIISKEKNLSNRENLLKKISEIEIYYVIFEQYGKNIITDDDLYKLYRIKFDILTLDVNYKFQDSYFNEYRYYYSIIEEKLNNLLRGNNDNIKVVFKEDYIKTLFKIKELLKNSNNEYDVHDILVTDYKLQTLLSFDSANGYKDLLYNYKIELLFSYEGENVNPGFNISLYNKPNNIFNYHSRNLYVSLKDLLELEYAKYYYYKTKNNDIHSINYESIFLKLKYYLFIQCNIYILYKINNENHNNIYYKIPEGIINLLTKDTYVRDKYDRDDIYDYFSGIKKLCNQLC